MSPPALLRIAVAFIERNRKFLIARRPAGGSFPELWELPGGKCGREETPEQCVAREVLEETGLTVQPVERLARVRHRYTGFAVDIHAYRCRIVAGRARPVKSTALAWVSWEELDGYAFPEANEALFAQIRESCEGTPGADPEDGGARP